MKRLPNYLVCPMLLKFRHRQNTQWGFRMNSEKKNVVGVVLRLVKSIVFEAIRPNISTLFIKKVLVRVVEL